MSNVPVTNVTVIAPDGTTLWSHQAATGNVSFGVASCGTYDIIAAGPGGGNVAIVITLDYSAPYL